MSTKTTLGIFGLGTVGTGVVALLRDNPQFDIRAISVRDRSKTRDFDFSQFEMGGAMKTNVKRPLSLSMRRISSRPWHRA